MQKQRDILELCFNELTHDRNTLRNLSSMAPRTFQRNMKKLENGERLGRKVGSGRPRMFSDSERQKICEFARSNPLSSSSKLSQIVAQETGKTAHRTTVAKYLFSSGYVQKLCQNLMKCKNRREKSSQGTGRNTVSKTFFSLMKAFSNFTEIP